MNDFRIDSHKLIYHTAKVNQWLEGKDICPIYVEIGPSGACNHRCIFCALDYVGYRKRFIDTKIFKKRLKEMARCGVKSVMYAGEGEPLLHKDISELIVHTKKTGIDVAVTTNGVLFTRELAGSCLGSLSWIRISLDAGTASTYARIHRCSKAHFNQVIKNLTDAVKLREKEGWATTIGAQFLLIPENCNEVVKAASLLRDTGVDYLIIKPFSQHPMSYNRLNRDFHYEDYFCLNDKLKKYSTKNFRIIFRIHTMKKLKEKERLYEHCLGLPFWAYIDSKGDVWACSAYLGNVDFLYGNIVKKSFQEIVKSARRKKILRMTSTKLDTSKCREVCRLDEVNRYLWELRHPHPHVNFI